MKNTVSKIICLLLSLSFLLLYSCSKVDENYGVLSDTTTPKKTNVTKDTKIPQIKSEDEVMPTYFDISLYDEENYADIYLGKDFEFKAVYVGTELVLPTNYKKFTDSGWSIVPESTVTPENTIQAGKSVKVSFVNGYSKQIIAVFHNSATKTRTVKECPLVKLIIPENVHYNPESVYGQFWVNGVSNECAITDIINYLGEPSHFYAVSDSLYYLDYFTTESDKRNGITVYINPLEDSVVSIEIANY